MKLIQYYCLESQRNQLEGSEDGGNLPEEVEVSTIEEANGVAMILETPQRSFCMWRQQDGSKVWLIDLNHLIDLWWDIVDNNCDTPPK